MKIVIDLTSLYDHLTGIERYALELSGHIMSQFPDNEYVLLFKNEIYKEFKPGGRYSLRVLSGNRNNISYRILKGGNKLLFNQFSLPSALNKIKADAYLFLAFPEPIFFNKKCVYTAVHDVSAFDCGENMKWLSKWYFRISNKHTFRNAKKIITISEFSKKRIEHYSKKAAKKTEIVYCGCIGAGNEKKLNLSDCADIRNKYNLPEEYILTLSTLEPRKNLRLLLEAYEKLLTCKHGCELPSLVLAGRMGWKMDGFLNDFSEELRNKLIFTGFVDDADLPYVYGNAKCFVFPSKYEGFGMPPLEAMAYGTMVLSSDSTSLPEVLGDAAMYFRSGDLENLVAMLERMNTISNKDKDDMLEKGYARVNEFCWDKEARKLMKALRF